MFYSSYFEDDGEFYDDRIFEHGESFKICDKQTSDTLVLHPHDFSTDFLKAIYKGKKWDVVSDPFVTSEIVEELINSHDRIVCLGHGSHVGLFGGLGFIIHNDIAHLLKSKKMVSIWCYASGFMTRHDLQGFYSGMFISEVGEAFFNGITDVDQEMINASNDLFASVLGKYIDSENILEDVKNEYVGEDDPIITFNRNRLFCNIGGN